MDSIHFSELNYEEMLRKHMGMMSINSKTPVRDKGGLALVYTPGVGASCLEIKNDSKKDIDTVKIKRKNTDKKAENNISDVKIKDNKNFNILFEILFLTHISHIICINKKENICVYLHIKNRPSQFK